MEDKMTILCVSNSYEQKYYLNEDFESLPQQIKDEALSGTRGVEVTPFL